MRILARDFFFFGGEGGEAAPLVVGNYRMVSRNELGLGGARPACAWQQGVVTCEGSRFCNSTHSNCN